MDFSEIRDDEDEREEVPVKRTGCLLGLVRLLLVLLIPLFILLALAPTLMSSDPAREWALKKINAAIAPATLAIDGWSFGWLSHPALEKVHFKDASLGTDVAADRIAFDRGLLRLLSVGRLNLGQVTVTKPLATVSLLPVAQAEKKSSGEKKGGGFSFLPVVDAAVTLIVDDGRARATGDGPESFEAQKIRATVILASIFKPVSIQTQMQVGGGTLSLDGRVQNPKDFFKGERSDEPEKLTLKAVGVDLTAFRPLLQHACGAPWIHNGTAEGAITVAVEGTDRFKIDGGMLINGLSVESGHSAPSPKADVAFLVNATVADRVVSISKFEFSSPWLRANASGTLQPGDKTGGLTGKLDAQADSDLAAVARDFAPVIGLAKEFHVQRGTLHAKIALAGDAKAFAVDADLTASDLTMTADGEPFTLKPAPSLVLKAKIPHGQWPEIETFHLKAPFADLYGSGRFDAAAVKGKIDLTLFSRDFKRVLKDAPPMVGSIYLDLFTKRADGRVGANLFVKFSDTAAELRPGQLMVVPQGTLKAEAGLPLKDGKPELAFQDATFDFTVGEGKISGGWRRLASAQGGRPLELRGFSLTSRLPLGDARRLAGGFIPATTQRRMTDWQGRAIVNATAEAAGGAVKARVNAAAQELVAGLDGGVWRVPDVRVEAALIQAAADQGLQIAATASGSGTFDRDGATVFAEKGAQLVVDAQFAPDGTRLALSKFDLTSTLLGVQAQGEIRELKTRCLADLKGKLSVDFAEVTRLLEAKGIDEIQIAGRGAREFHLVAPLAGGATTLASDGTFTGAAYVGSLTGFGLRAGASDLSLRLAQSRLKVAYSPALNGGALRLIPELTTERGITTLVFPPQTRLLENVTITQETVETLLVHLNPLFQGSVVQNGTVTHDLKSFRAVSGLAPGKGLTADTTVLFKNLKLELGPSLLELLAMLKVKGRTYDASELKIHATIKDGRVYVDPVTLVVDKQPVTFSGWVAFDGSIQYLIEVPLTDRVTGGAGGKLLKGTTVRIPVTGTVDHPRLDTSALQNTIGSLIKNTVGEHAAEKVSTFLQKLQEELQK